MQQNRIFNKCETLSLVPIEALTKKDKKESSKSTLKLRKGKKEKIFGSNPTEDHFVKFKPLMNRVIQVNSGMKFTIKSIFDINYFNNFNL